MPKLVDLTGVRFGNLIVLDRVQSRKKATLWRCRCSCGKETIVQTGNLRSGHTKSCGKCNTIIHLDDHMECIVKNGRSFLFDKDDLPIVESRTWTVDNHVYVRGVEDGRTVWLHQLIMGANTGSVVDHINCDPSDCRKNNLRVASQHQNSMNHSLNRNSTTGFKGVCFDKKANNYMAHIHPNGKMIFLGYFDSPIEAAFAYDRAASFYFGEYANLNFKEGVSA